MQNRKGKFAKACAVVLSLAMTVATAGISTEADAAAKPKLAKKTVTVKVGKTGKISIKGKKIKKTTWSVKDKKTAKLTKKSKTSATVKGVKAGTTKVTAKVKAGKKTYKLTATVKVKAAETESGGDNSTAAPSVAPSANASASASAPAASATPGATQRPQQPVMLDKTEATVDYYKSITLVATVKDNPDAKVVWTTSDEKVATVEDGVVTAVGEDGQTAEITATVGSDSDTCKVTVKKIPLGSVIVQEDFEDGTSHYTGPRNTQEEVSVEVVDGGANGSSKCYKAFNRTSVAQGAVVDLTEICEPGSTYDFSAYIKAGENVTNKSVSLIISSEIRAVETGEESYDNLAVITEKAGNFQGDAEEHYADPQQWNEIKYTFTAPDDMYHFGLYLETKLDKCDLFIDDIKITLKERNIPDYTIESLGKAYENIFDNFGVGASYDNIMGENASAFIANQFNAFTPGNCFKPDAILTEELTQLTIPEAKEQGYYIPADYEKHEGNQKSGVCIVPALDFTRVDQVLEKAHAMGIKIRLHTLVWHQQTSVYFFKDKYKLAVQADNTDPETMNTRLDYYINNVLNHILKKDLELAGGDKSKCRLVAVDVVNEYSHSHAAADKTVNRNGLTFYEEIYGKKDDGSYIYNEKNAMSTTPAYVKYAFKLANDVVEANGREDILLTNNDFNTYYPNTTQEIIDTVKYINAKDDLNPEGKKLCKTVGMQMHTFVGNNANSVEAVKTTVEKFVAEGLQIEVTEWDAGIGSKDQVDSQAKYYKDVMNIFIQNKANVKSVVLWSLYDALSWRYESIPCVFKGLYNIKPAYTALLETAKAAK